MTIFDLLKNEPDGVYIRFTREVLHDESMDGVLPDKMDEGFWPSLSPKHPGFIGEDKTGGDLVRETERAQARYDDFASGNLGWVGVRARANINRKQTCDGKHFITTYTLSSTGVWGIESDTDDSYLQELYIDQCSELETLFSVMATEVRYI